MAWTDSETDMLVAAYGDSKNFDDACTVMAQYGKSVASVRMKLVKLGLYEKATPSKPKATKVVVEAPQEPLNYHGDLRFFRAWEEVAKLLDVEPHRIQTMQFAGTQAQLILLNALARKLRGNISVLDSLNAEYK